MGNMNNSNELEMQKESKIEMQNRNAKSKCE